MDKCPVVPAQLFSLREASGFLRLSESSLRDKIRSGEVSGYKIGRGYFVDQDGITSYMLKCHEIAVRGRASYEEVV